jgi:Rrf2 family protein
MMISAKCDYACRAMLELALHWPSKKPLQIQSISENQGIPVKYLIQILIQLKKMGLAASIRGKFGGYNLAKHPADITLGRIARQMEGSLLHLSLTARKKGSVFAPVWNDAKAAMADVLDGITLEDMCNRIKGVNKELSYQI